MSLHCTWLLGSCEAGDNYANQLKDLLVHSCPKRVAGFFAESIQVTEILSTICVKSWSTILGCWRNSSISQELPTSSCGDDQGERWFIHRR